MTQKTDGSVQTIQADLAIQNIMIVLADELEGAERELAMVRTSNIALQLSQLGTGQVVAKFALESLVMEDRTARASAQTIRPPRASTRRCASSRSGRRIGGMTTTACDDGRCCWKSRRRMRSLRPCSRRPGPPLAAARRRALSL